MPSGPRDGEQRRAAGALLRGQEIGLTLAVAAIDVGSNAARLTILKVGYDGRATDEIRHRWPLRLGADVFSGGRIGEGRRGELLAIFAAIAQLLDEHAVKAYRAVGTAALREAANRDEVLRAVAAHSGLAMEVIDGAQESALVEAALLRAVGSQHADALIMDLGGGSCELSRPRARRGRSLPLGAVRLLEQLPALAAPLAGVALEQARERVEGMVRREVGRVRPAPLAVGAGGTLEALARLLPQPHRQLPTLAVADLEPFLQATAAMSPQERRRAYRTHADRADLMLPAVLLLLALARCYGVAELVVPGSGLREALLHRLLWPAGAGHSARRLLGQGHDHAALARRAAKLAAELFVDLAPVHRLWPPALEPLITATYAWSFGAFLEPSAAARHAVYLLLEVGGLRLDTVARRAAVYAVRSMAGPPPPWEGDEPSRRAAEALGGLLRLALTLGPLARRSTPLGVDILTEPLTIVADLSTALPEGVLAPVERALGRRLAVR